MKGEKKNEGSQYNVEINMAMYIDAEKEGNCTWFISNRSKDFNPAIIPVRTLSMDTVCVVSIKPIQENGFVSIHYGQKYSDSLEWSLHETRCPK